MNQPTYTYSDPKVQGACSVAGCDPSGVVCASVCGAVELVKIGVEAAVLPLKLCKDLDGDIDSAVVDADYANGVGILSDLSFHDSRLAVHDGSLATHDGKLTTHDFDIKALLGTLLNNQNTIMQNQELIIELLKTPSGRRDDWNHK